MVVKEKMVTRLWYQMYEMAEAYYKAHGDLNVPARYTDPQSGKNLGAWIANQRSARRPNTTSQTITERQIQMLDEIGMEWGREGGNEEAWEEYIQRIADYKAEHGDCNVPRTYDDGRSTYPLGKLVQDLRCMHRGTDRRKIPPKYESMLEKLEFGWGDGMEKISRDNWEAGISALKDYLANGGTQAAITAKFVWKGFKLGPWLNSKLCAYRGAKSYSPISPERVAELRSIGIDMDARKIPGHPVIIGKDSEADV